MSKLKRLKQIGLWALVLLVFGGCASARKTQQSPPGFLDRIVENTTVRFNSYYNSNQLYQSSLRGGEEGYSENYEELLPVSIQDAVAESGAVTGEMDQILQKTATSIDRRPYSKWVDDNYLLSGIAHYIKGEYDMAEDIFSFVTAEYTNGVDIEKVGNRQQYKRTNTEKLKKQQAKAKQEELARQKREQYDKDKQARIAKKAAKKAKKDQEKNDRPLSKKEQFELREKARKEGRELSSKEVIEEFQDKTKEEKQARKDRKAATKKEDLDKIRTAKTLENKESKPDGLLGFLKHKLASKDAALWLAKTYITTEDFISAQAVLTAINEDENFPKRLDQAFYLTNADMQVRLNNIPKATEYVQLAIDATKKRRDKGRLYFVMGQLFEANGQNALAEEAFGKVRKYHPTYNTIYHAEMNNIRRSIVSENYDTEEMVKRLKKMSNDEKNLEFMDEVYYNLGRAYSDNNEPEKAEKTFLKALDETRGGSGLAPDINLALADFYYANKDYQAAGPRYTDASSGLDANDERAGEAKLKAEALETINAGLAEIHKQDSLLQIANLPEKELEKMIRKRVNDEVKAQRQKKLESLGNSGNSIVNDQQNNTNRNSKRNRNEEEQQTFYFFDLNQSASGFSEFRQKWGDRPSRDGWRRYDYVKRFIARNNNDNRGESEEQPLTEDDLFAAYLAEIPTTPKAQEEAHRTIQENYLKVGEAFVEKIGDQENGISTLETLLTTYPSTEFKPEAYTLLSKAHAFIGNTQEAADFQRKAGTPARPKENNVDTEVPDLLTIDELYEKVFNAYSSEEYERAINLGKKANSYASNPYEDKFAYIRAVSIGKVEGQEEMKKALEEFKKAHSQSPLTAEADRLLQQMK